MAEASIHINLFNPGQVFACMGFLEAADALVGDAEGGFDWSNDANVRFWLRAKGDDNPFGVVLGFLAGAEILRRAPLGYADPPAAEMKTIEPKQKTKGTKKATTRNRPADSEAGEDVVDGRLYLSEAFPGREADAKTLPIRLEHDGRYVDVGHWCDGSSRNDFKLYAGTQRGPAIARQMLQRVAALRGENENKLEGNPFDLLIPMGGSSFKFDARKAWTPIDAGYSPDKQSHGVDASPVVEILAAAGLEHARPDEYERRKVRYGAWGGYVPLVLARPALAGAHVGVPVRLFRFTLELSGKNKVVTFAQEEANT